ncbi:serine/threonine-protein kinase 4 [Planoprotostelium fungivorum]|uniref:non-specific serine/threonine protein kinase n=1 Tax=Planoprotostelium fungivorum TaxID=1890364 RepID=A0A2P6P0Q0_9EUKA|nr:serine/threonine-protein kinase 4 [Planoprotostelium fungivorum]
MSMERVEVSFMYRRGRVSSMLQRYCVHRQRRLLTGHSCHSEQQRIGSLKNSMKDDGGQTLLHGACTDGNLDLVKKLMKKKGNINEPDDNGWTPFHCACNSSSFSLEMLGYILRETPVDVTAQTEDGSNGFHYLVRQNLSPAEEPFLVAILLQMLERAPFIHLPTKKNHEYPLHIAAMRGNKAIVKFLLENGSKPDMRNSNKETALHYAAGFGSTEIARMLLEYGANKYALNNKGETALDLGKRTNKAEINELLGDVKFPALFRSVRSNKPSSVSMFCKSNNDGASLRDGDGRTAFMHAATLSTFEVMDTLLKTTTDDSANSTRNFRLSKVTTLKPPGAPSTNDPPLSTFLSNVDNNNWTLMHYLAYLPNDIDAQILSTLAKRGGSALLEKGNNSGDTPLHFGEFSARLHILMWSAALLGHTQFARFLLENNVPLNVTNNLDETPLYYATISQSRDIIRLLLERSANPDEGKNLYDITDAAKDEFGLPKRMRAEVKKTDRKMKKEERKHKSKSERMGGDLEISGPSHMRRVVHVTTDYQWEMNSGDAFDLAECIGQGAYGSVYRALQKETNYVLAIKQVPAGDKPEDIEKEITVLKRCKDTNIVSYLGCFTRESRLWILMEFCGCGSMQDIFKKLNKDNRLMTERQLAALLVFVLNGLMYLHDSGIIHRDLKPANILLNAAGEAKLADFGVSTQLSNTMAKAATTIGTPLYMSPEVIEGNSYDFKADIWSTGITVIELATGKIPFASENMLRAIGLIVSGPAPKLDDPTGKWSPSLHSFVDEACVKEPSGRKSAAELLNHSLISAYASQDHRKSLREMLAPYYPEALESKPTTADILYSVKKAKKAAEAAAVAAANAISPLMDSVLVKSSGSVGSNSSFIQSPSVPPPPTRSSTPLVDGSRSLVHSDSGGSTSSPTVNRPYSASVSVMPNSVVSAPKKTTTQEQGVDSHTSILKDMLRISNAEKDALKKELQEWKDKYAQLEAQYNKLKTGSHSDIKFFKMTAYYGRAHFGTILNSIGSWDSKFVLLIEKLERHIPYHGSFDTRRTMLRNFVVFQ